MFNILEKWNSKSPAYYIFRTIFRCHRDNREDIDRLFRHCEYKDE